uniref:Uncharacterized protein n=1 Tax=Xiphophorus couchianus TaxID=32473 RepID=A0A3B5LXU1_9TELE
MANPHRTNVLVTSCLKTPVDPHTKAPLASYERERVLPYSATMDALFKCCKCTDYLDLSKIFFSNEEYYSKLEELKKAHLRTMEELESMYQQKLQLRSMDPLDMATLEPGHRKQDVQRKREYRQEIREMRERVQGRLLLLEQVTQVNVSTKQKHAHHLYQYAFTKYSKADINCASDNDEEREEQKSDQASLNRRESEDASGHHGDDPQYSDESYNYSDDHENFSDDSEHDVDDKQELVD